MIKIKSFFPFSNFMRVTQEFYGDKGVVKIKSLIAEREFEFEYKETIKIVCKKITSGDQQRFGLTLNITAGLIFAFFFKVLRGNPTLFQVTQLLFICGATLFLTSYVKRKTIFFMGKNDKILTSIRSNQKNYSSIKEVVELVKNKSEILEETTCDKTFPEAKPVFELIEYDLLDYLSLSSVRFYENELIGIQKSIIEENTTNVKYAQLNGRVYRGKQSSDSWDSAFFVTLMLSAIFVNFYSAFGILPRTAFLIIFTISGILLVIFFLLRFVRWEYIGLYDKNNKMVYWTWITKSKKEKIEEIIKFIQSKISAENKA